MRQTEWVNQEPNPKNKQWGDRAPLPKPPSRWGGLVWGFRGQAMCRDQATLSRVWILERSNHPKQEKAWNKTKHKRSAHQKNIATVPPFK